MISLGLRILPHRPALARAGTALALAVTVAMSAGAATAQSTTEPDTGIEAETEAETEAEAPAPPPIIIGEAEAMACAARLEPMVSAVEDAKGVLYLRRLGETAYQVWAPRSPGPQVPMEPWCVTTLDAIAGVPFLDTQTRSAVMDLVVSAGEGPPPPRVGTAPPQDEVAPPPEVIVESDEEEAPGLPAAFQRLPPKGGRSAPTLGLPVPMTPALSPTARADAEACLGEGGQPTAVVDRFTGKVLDAACWLPDGTAGPLPSLSADLDAGH